MDVRLSIDLGLQRLAESAMDSTQRGALIAMDPNTGEILALVSRPAFNPDIFSTVVPPEVWRELNDDTERPLFNRVTMGTYPPGSTAKMVTATAGLDIGVIDTTTRLRSCGGGYAYGNRVYACWNKSGHGSLNVVHAIESSCNVFFYQVGERVGIDRWGTYARIYGLGGEAGIDLPTEDDGVVPSTQVYNRRLGRGKWGRGEALNVGIGQGIVLVTPVQMVRYVAAVATGNLVTPHSGIGFTDTSGVQHAAIVKPPKPVNIPPGILQTIRRGMVLVTEGGGGTAHRAAVPGFHVAGKTGTAQNPHGDDHSWFVGFAPADHPTIAVAVICENAGHGSTKAAPIAGALFRHMLIGPEPVRQQADSSIADGNRPLRARN
jgi:penicillin-binding protein 2